MVVNQSTEAGFRGGHGGAARPERAGAGFAMGGMAGSAWHEPVE
jgi:hypothetical protein